jgi:hypothetical protein
MGTDTARPFAATIFLPLLAAACGGGFATTPVRIDSFTATPPVISAGSEVVLEWRVAGDVAVLALSRDGVELGEPEAPSGSRRVGGLEPGLHLFLLRAADRLGATREARALVEVLETPRIVAFEATPPVRTTRGSSTLSWEVTGAERVRLLAAEVVLLDTDDGRAREGRQVVRPDRATDYLLVATGPGGSDQRTLRVEVLGAPLFELLEATPPRVARGGRTTLRWQTRSASALRIRSGDATVLDVPGQQVAAGTHEVVLGETTSFTFEATGEGGISSAELRVVVEPRARILAFVAQPSTVVAGATTTLTWRTEGIDLLELRANGESLAIDAPVSEGSVDLRPAGDTSYELWGAGLDGSDVATALVEVHGVPVIEHFAADPAERVIGRGPAVLSWRTRGAGAVSIEDAGGVAVEVAGLPL